MALIPAVVFGLLTFWLHRRLVRATALPRPWSVVVDAALVVLWALALVGFVTGRWFDPGWARPLAFAGFVWLAAFFYLFLGLAAVGLVSFGASTVRRLRRRSRTEGPEADGEPPDSETPDTETPDTETPDTETPDSSAAARLRRLRIATAAVIVVALGTTAYGIVEASRPQVTEVGAELPGLPEQFDGLRIAVVSDLHVGPTRDASFTRRVVDQVNARRPDLILLVGDLTDGRIPLVRDTLEPIADLRAPLGVFGVSGNHEYYSDDGGRWLDVWEELGVRTLRNDRVPLTVDGATIQLAGVHDATAPEPYEPDLPAALEGSDPDDFVLLLAHQPKQVVEASELGVGLQFSGHTHGGQLWPIRYLVPLQQPSVTGLERFGDTTLYTTRGAGAWGPPVRVLAPPEITMFTLQASP
ncbi:Uncharacterized metallophosphoesterase Cj0846 [Gordonia paraffinivorans]|uniref:Uncharacterized metallophosphoesterase Cj0846 n=1 Tax=Gordonia paraffinivorans TaxID=175628 RepID=A0ABD7V232_9ACTN|nr:metallophosphoesterase [Gordonia paraffinivorans]VFA88414.1 Uncharacterized metallophosphoesterase Cj0846 [Gordonia paraffinivorans]